MKKYKLNAIITIVILVAVALFMLNFMLWIDTTYINYLFINAQSFTGIPSLFFKALSFSIFSTIYFIGVETTIDEILLTK